MVNLQMVYIKELPTSSKIHVFKAFDKLGKGYVSDVLFSLKSYSLKVKNIILKFLCLPFELLTLIILSLLYLILFLKKLLIHSIISVLPSGSNRNIDGSITGML